MKSFKYLKCYWNTRNIRPSDELTPQQLNELYQAAKAEHKIWSILKGIWAAVLGICTIIAAIFSVLTFFK